LSDLELRTPQAQPEPDIALLDSDPPPKPPRPVVETIFLGDDGLRAGWSILLFIILVALMGRAVGAIMKHLALIPKSLPTELTPRVAIIEKTIEFLIFAIPAFLMSLIERRPFSRYGLALRRALADFSTGFFWGFLALSALVGTLYFAHGLAFDGIALHGVTAAFFALKWGLVFFLVGLGEEFIFRGYLQYTLARGIAGIVRVVDANNRYSHAISFWITAFIFSVLLFILAHTGNGGENFIGLLQVGLAGTVLAFALYRTGSLWWAIGMHNAWDWAQSYFYGTPDSGLLVAGHLISSHPLGSKLLSGGPDGPEGSVLGIPTLLLLALIIHLTLPKRNYPLTPDQSPPA